jgi:hypothetical protein
MMPVVTLKNGLRIGNLSSPHPFEFDDGTVLPACDPERTKSLPIEIKEIVTTEVVNNINVDQLKLELTITSALITEIERIQHDDDVDIVLAPLMVLEAMKGANMLLGKIRAIRTKDRITKVIFSNRFCI